MASFEHAHVLGASGLWSRSLVNNLLRNSLASLLTLGAVGVTRSKVPSAASRRKASWLWPWPKGFWLKSSSKKTTPQLHTSTLLLIVGEAVSWHSGGRYHEVPAPREERSMTSAIEMDQNGLNMKAPTKNRRENHITSPFRWPFVAFSCVLGLLAPHLEPRAIGVQRVGLLGQAKIPDLHLFS